MLEGFGQCEDRETVLEALCSEMSEYKEILAGGWVVGRREEEEGGTGGEGSERREKVKMAMQRVM